MTEITKIIKLTPFELARLQAATGGNVPNARVIGDVWDLIDVARLTSIRRAVQSGFYTDKR